MKFWKARRKTFLLMAMLLSGGVASAQVVVKGNVYGGCEYGEVVGNTTEKGNTSVNINGGTIGDPLSLKARVLDNNAQFSERVNQGNVYGGGDGYKITGHTGDNNDIPVFDPNAGRVQRNTEVIIGGNAVVRRAVYGGGNIATVGMCSVNETTGVATYTSGGQTNVTITDNALVGPKKTDLTAPSEAALTQASTDFGETISQSMYIDTAFKYLGGNEGWVFGGSRGVSGEELKHLSFVNTTIVAINGNAQLMTVFGGGENGHVQTSTNVTIGGNAVVGGIPLHGSGSITIPSGSGEYSGATFTAAVNETYEDGFGVGSMVYRGSVFGGGKGTDFVSWLSPKLYDYDAGRVYGNSNVTVEETPTIYNRVYGGGAIASVGTFTYASNSHTVTGISGNTGHTYVTVTGGTIGTDGHNNGEVYGGGRGYPGRAQKATETTTTTLHQAPDLAYVGHTHVTVEGGAVKNSVYGGGANGHVQGDATVLIKQTNSSIPTTIGIEDLGTWHSNVYGAGGGTAQYKDTKIVNGNPEEFTHHSITAGRVFGDVNLTIEGGKIWHNVYGGGSLASVGTYLAKDSNNQTIPYVGGGNITINITGGEIGKDGNDNGMVFGSGRGEVVAPGAFLDSLTYAAYTTVNIGSGTVNQETGEATNLSGSAKINGSVYGSGENGHVYLQSTINIFGGTIGIAAADYDPANPDPHFTHRGNVYGAGCGTDKYDSDNDTHGDTYSPNSGYVWGNTFINIYGGYISRNVYGGGAIGSVGVLGGTVPHTNTSTQAALSWPYDLSFGSIPNESGTMVSTGKATINIRGGHIGTKAAPMTSGNVFGSCRGDVGPLGVMEDLAFARETEVTVNFTPTVTSMDDVDENNTITPNVIIGSVYGSGEDGSVYENTKVTVTNGLIGGSVFGGGSGTTTYKGRLKSTNGTDDNPNDDYWMENVDLRSITAGKVYGNTVVEINGGYVLHNVYGGGNLASVGKGNYIGYGEMTSSTSGPVDPPGNSGKCTVTLKGGTIGTTGLPDENGNLNGYVYGSSRGTTFPVVNNPQGTPRYDYSRDFFLGYANKTEVNIGDANTGPTIMGSVFGGGDNGHVRWHTNVTVTNGEIGVAYEPEQDEHITDDKWVYRGNVHGAGRGIDKIVGSTTDYCQSAGSVTLNTTVTVNGGIIHRNVYGGGLLSTIGPPPTGYNPGTSTCYVNINGGTIGEELTSGDEPLYGGDIFGGSRGILDMQHANLNSFASASNTEVNIDNNANVLGNVYGGGELGQVKLESQVNLIAGTTKGSVFGGGKGDVTEVIAGAVKGNSTVDMTGGTVERSIYGGGKMGSVGTFTAHTTYNYTSGTHSGSSVDVPTACEDDTGLATVIVKGGFVGKDGSLMPWTNHNIEDDDRGWIFCGAQGVADSITYYKAPALGVVGSTYLEINKATGENPPAAPVITASVYGGSENGLVLGNTHVVIADGQIGTGHYVENGVHKWDPAYNETKWTNAIAAIGNPTSINTIAAQFHECDAWTYASPYQVYDIYANETSHPNNDSGHADYQMAALEATNGQSFFGNVFGGGSGYYPIATGVWRRTAGQVNGNAVVDITGGHILTNVFGGNEMTDVKGKCTINMSGGTVGIPRTVTQIQNNPTQGNIYGAGMGDFRSMFDTYTDVNETEVNVTGGTVFGSVFGGSEEGHVLGHAVVNIGQGEGKTTRIGTTGYSGYDGHVFGGGRGNAKKLNRKDPDPEKDYNIANFASGRVGGKATVTMTNGTVMGNLYGGGLVARTGVGETGSFDTYVTGTSYDSQNHGVTTVALSGGIVGNPTSNNGTDANKGYYLLLSEEQMGNVYGGGRGDKADFIEDDLGRAAKAVVNITSTSSGYPTIYGSVFGGGQMANVGHWRGYGANQGYAEGTSLTTVTITGSPIIGTAREFSNDYATSSHPQTEFETINEKTRLHHTRTGNVFGSGQGAVRLKHNEQGNLIGTGHPEGLEHGHCGQTQVDISGSPTIMSSVYGGADRGVVWGNTDVRIAGGTIGTLANADDTNNDNKYYYGSVYGGCYGMDAYYHMHLPTDTPEQVVDSINKKVGHVYGKTYVELTGGTVHGNVFGGGNLGTVDGLCEVKISKTGSGTGPEIGPLESGTSMNASVYGGGKGFYEDPNELRKKYANVGSTKVTVEGGNIKGSVFGGGSESHTLGNTEVIVHNGANIGTDGLSTWDGNIFGGGRNFLNTNNTNGRVAGNVTITMDGGSIQGSIFGGGRMALTGVDEDGNFPTTSWTVADHGNVTINVSGTTSGSDNNITYNTVIGNGSDQGIHLLTGSDESVGDIFGSGKGDTKEYDDILAGCVTNTTINITGSPRIHGAVFGGGEMASIGWLDSDNNIIDGTGEATIKIGDSEADKPVIGTYLELNHDYLDGSITINGHGYPRSPWTIIETEGGVERLVHTCTGNVFGGCQGDVDFEDWDDEVSSTWNNWPYMGRSKKSTITVNGGTIMGNVFGGPEQGTMDGNTTITINGGTIGTQVTASNNDKYYFGGVYGAGYGSDDSNEDNHAITVNGVATTAKMRAGRVYGNVHTDVFGGTINGDVYGGASFAYVGGEGTSPNGDVELNIGYKTTTTDSETDEEVDNFYGEAKILGSVYGANNRSGTPYGKVEVNVYKTKHWVDEQLGSNYAPETPEDGWTHELLMDNTNGGTTAYPKPQQYALREVFGGGNRASFTPNQTGREFSTNGRRTTVHIWSCENTIRDLYGGGNAADIGTSANNADIDLIVDGGRFYRVFSGGNGESGTPANIYGWANNTINSGVINELYGGGNQAGNILHTNLTINEEPNGCAEFIDNTFGGSNEAPIIGDVETDLLCGEGSAYEFYGGTNNADIYGNVTLNVHGGFTENLYGGSKGSERPANIKKFPTIPDPRPEPGQEGYDAMLDRVYQYMIDHHIEAGYGGNVIVNLYGGTIKNVFGGSNISGNIEGNIWVNVIDIENADCPLDITNLYGGCNNTDYEPVDHTAANPVISPVVNVVHIKETNTTPGYIRHNVFGGSLGHNSDVVANPVVNIGYDATTMAGYIPAGYTVKPAAQRNVKVAGNVYGGGEEGIVNGSTTVNVFEGEVGLMEYFDSDEDDEDPTLDVVNHVKYDGTNYGGSVFGGGMGSKEDADHGRVKGNSTVNIKGGHVQYNVYGGGELASVGEHTPVYETVNEEPVLVDFVPDEDNGLATVNVTGGQVGPAPMVGTFGGKTYNIPIALNGYDGYVFGGGKGEGDDAATAYKTFANVNSTSVTVQMPMDDGNHANRIWGSIFGGAEDGHVLGDAYTYFRSGLMGTDGTTSYDGNIFGGGRNYSRKNTTAGRVGGNTHVEMTNGQIYGNIYGGGRLALTGTALNGIKPLGEGRYQALRDDPDANTKKYGHTFVYVKGGTVGNDTKVDVAVGNNQTVKMPLIETFSTYSMGNVYGGGKGSEEGLVDYPKTSALLVSLTKNTTVEISQEDDDVPTRIWGIVFGGGETANVGQFSWHQVGDNHGTVSDIRISEGLAKVRIHGGIIGADRAKMRYEKDPDYPYYPRFNDDLGYVYGGCEGISDDPDKVDDDNNPVYPDVQAGPTSASTTSLINLLATVNNTDVRITGGWVKASVFGGGESGHVRGNTKVTLKGGQIGAGYDENEDEDEQPYTDGIGDTPNQFVNPATTEIITSNSLKGTYHWDYGETLHPGEENEVTIYSPYDPVDVMNGTKPSDGKSWFGNVFGGGSGWFPYIKNEGTAQDPDYKSYWNPESGKVWGNTEVIIADSIRNGNIVSKPHILNNVYGGNEMTDVGGNAIVTMNGGTIGVPRISDDINTLPTFGYLFGGGCGDPRAESLALNNVGGKTVVTVTGGIIYGSVYGGAEDGHVIGNTEVYVGQGEGKTTIIGCAGTSYDDGNIFGSGRNYLLKNYTGGRVGGNTLVEMTGGLALGSVYGGGRNAMVGLDEDLIEIDSDTHEVQALQNGPAHGKTTVRVKGGTVGNLAKMRETGHTIGYVYGGGKGSKVGPAGHPAASPLLISLVKNTEVFISQDAADVPTRIYGRVYGGGEVANVGNYGWKPVATAPNISEIQLLSDGQAGQAKVDVSGGVIGLDNMQMKTASGIPDDFGHVFGGGEGWTQKLSDSPVIDVEGNHLVELMATVGNTDVTIDGSAFVLGSVYGGSSEGHVLTNTLVKIKGGQIGAGNGVVDSEGHNRPYTDDEWDYAQYQSLPECAQWDYEEGGAPYDPNIIEGGKPKPGKNGATFYGNVFGGGSGYYPYGVDTDGNSQWLRSAGQVRGNTRVEVTGGHILTSLYGGCETTDVGTYRYSNVIHGEDHVSGGQSTVIMSGGTLGVPRTLAEIQAHPVTCYVFGSGKGDPRFYFNTWTNVWNSKVEIKGTAWVYGSVFGGGEEAHVLNDVDLDVSGNAKIGTLGYSYVDGNIFGGGRGFTGKALTAGTVGGNIDITITGGTMLGSVYGGGRLASVGTYLVDKEYNNGSGMVPNPYYGHFQPGDDHGKITINITGGTIGNDYETATLTHTNSDTYGGNVFGGCMGKYIAWSGSGDKPIWPSLARAKQTVVTISGTAKIKNSVYGGGEIGTVRDNTTVNINGGTIGADYGTSPNKMYCGSVFGGGKGIMEMSTDNDSTMVAAYLAGRVYGNTYVNINGGQVYENVFGGGKVASVGWVKTDGTFVNGEATVKMTGGIIGPLDYSGVNAYIFGGPKGGQNDDMKPYCNVNSTSVEVDYTDSNANRVWGSLFGGGSDGHVLGNASVTLKNGTVGTEGATGYDGNIFGGGRNYHELSLTAGRVGGNITVNMQGGQLMGCIFGGGRQGLTGIDMNGTAVDDNNHGNVTVTMSSGTIGKSTEAHSYMGQVFGGGKGDNTKDDDDVDFYKRMGETRSTNVTISGGKVYGNVYGGSENGRVLQNAEVTINGSALIGAESSESAFQGNVYGGGLGMEPYAGTDPAEDNPNAGHVFGLSRVNIKGGTVTKSVFGGGNKGLVNVARIVNVEAGTVYEDVFGGNRTIPDAEGVVNNSLKTVNIRGGQINGNVYGSSYDATEGNAPDPDVTPWPSGETYWSSFVNITGGTIGEDVYGAGYGGTVYGSNCVLIGLEAIKKAPTYVNLNGSHNDENQANKYAKDGISGNGYPTPAKIKIMGNVYDGSDHFGSGEEPMWNNFDIRGYSQTFLDGTGYNTADDNEGSTDKPYMNIEGGLYGCGTLCESGKKGRQILVRNYGERITKGGEGADKDNMEDATRTLTTIQRGGYVLLDNSNIHLSGAIDISKKFPDRKFGVLQVDNGFYATNASGLVLGEVGAPAWMDSITEVRSLYLRGTNTTSYDHIDAMQNSDYWEMVGINYSNNRLYRTVTSTGQDDFLAVDKENVIIFNGNSKLWVRNYNTTADKILYGQLYGFFRVKADYYQPEGTETFAYARPKLSPHVNRIDISDIVPGFNPDQDRLNPDDGGFLSYNTSHNTFVKGGITVLGWEYLNAWDGDDGGNTFTNTKQYPYFNISQVSKSDVNSLNTEDYRVWMLPYTLGNKWYVDGRGIGNGGWGQDKDHQNNWGDYPDMPKLSISGANGICNDETINLSRPKFNPAEDVIFVVGPVSALAENENLNKWPTEHPLKLYRYPGGHPMSNGQKDATHIGSSPYPSTPPADTDYAGLVGNEETALSTAGPGPNYGAIINANRTDKPMVMDNVVVNGLYTYDAVDMQELDIPAAATHPINFADEKVKVHMPMVVTTPGAKLTLKGGTVLEGGYNNTDASGTFTIGDNSVKNFYLNPDFNDLAFNATGKYNGGALYVATDQPAVGEDPAVPTTVNVEGKVTITGNLQKNGSSTIKSNVYLPTFDKSLTITAPLAVGTEIGVTSPIRNTSDDYRDNTLSPVAMVEKSEATPAANGDIASTVWSQGNFLDDQDWFFGNGGHTTYYDNLGYEGAGNEYRSLYFGWTWANVVREAPSGFDVSNIDSKEDLAWLISLNTGMNGATATNFSGQDLLQKTDLDMKQYVWVPIGDDSHNGFEHKSFAGHFDGQGHLIKNINIDYIGRGDTRYEHQDYGLFGHVNGSVERTFVVSGTVSPKVSIDLLNTDMFNIGGLAGGLQNATLANSEAALHIYAPDEANYHVAAGGLVAKVMPGGEIHSSMAMPVMETTDKTVENATGASVGGLVGNAAGGNVYNSFVNAQFNVYGNPKAGGLMGSNDGAKVENCYVAFNNTPTEDLNFDGLVSDGYSDFDSCYVQTGYPYMGVTEDRGHHFTATNSSDLYGYMYKDNTVKKSATVAGATVDTAMFRMLNHWVDGRNKTGNKYARWSRPGLSEINGDYPVLLLDDIDGTTAHQGDFSTVATIHGTNVLQYGGTVRDGKQLDGAIERMVAGSAKDAGDALFVYGDITETPSKNPASNTKISIQEDVAIMNPGTLSAYDNTYVGITFDNSFGKATATPGMNDGLFGSDNLDLPRDWHMFSTPLSNAPLGFDYLGDNVAGSQHKNNPWENPDGEFSWITTRPNNEVSDADGLGYRYWMKSYETADGYFPTTRGYDLTGNVSDWFIENSDECPSSGNTFLNRYPYGMDFYTWNEPEYHWINFKRNGPNHWHSDTPHVHLDYKPAEVKEGQTPYTTNQNEDNLIVGRGYMAAIATETFMQSHGLLNAGDQSIILTNNGWKIKGWNMVGNPFHGYLDFNELGKADGPNEDVLTHHDNNGEDEGAFYVIYDADKYQNRNASTAYRYYPVKGSPEGADYADRFLHPHQGFYVKTDTHLSELKINENMLVTRDFVEKNGGSHFRATQPSYPLVNLYLNSDKGCADVTVIEFERPEWGGARKVKELRVGDGLFYAHHGDTYYAALFAKEGIDRVPLWFEAKEDDIFTMKWNMANGNFHSMYLIDNITGVQYDMLRNDTYTFEGHKEDYPSRFLIVFDLTDVEEFEDDNEHPFAFFNGSEWVVTGEGDLEFIDMLGRVLAKSHISGQNRITLPMVADGPYLFRLTNHKETRIQKVIVTK